MMDYSKEVGRLDKSFILCPRKEGRVQGNVLSRLAYLIGMMMTIFCSVYLFSLIIIISVIIVIDTRK